jgi:hypothetical protein
MFSTFYNLFVSQETTTTNPDATEPDASKEAEWELVGDDDTDIEDVYDVEIGGVVLYQSEQTPLLKSRYYPVGYFFPDGSLTPKTPVGTPLPFEQNL